MRFGSGNYPVACLRKQVVVFESKNPGRELTIGLTIEHTHTRAHIHAKTHTHTHKYTHSRTHTKTHTKTHTHKERERARETHTHTHTHTHTPTPTHTHTHTPTHTHTQHTGPHAADQVHRVHCSVHGRTGLSRPAASHRRVQRPRPRRRWHNLTR